ncbi:MAG TPA: MMPL family transporter, partial [Candidatus Polarisedimenticolia bacterium]|nr:MMPL family transporter [Candidatus Polarisedimenticolia bacterium]
MWRIPLYFFEHPRKVLGVALAAAVLAVVVASGLSLDVSSEALIPPDSPQRRAQDEVARLFGAEESAVVFAADPALFTPARLVALREVHDALAALPSVARVDSLFSLPDLRDENGALATEPLVGAIPQDAAALERLRRRLTAHPLYRGSIVAEDGGATLLRLVLRERAGADPRGMAAAMEAALAPRRAQFATLEAVGGATLRIGLEDTLRRDQWVILPITTLVLFSILALTLRSPLLAAIPIVNGALATALTLAAMAALGIPVNLLTATLPALILVVGGMEDVHLLVEFRERMHEHGLEKLAVYETTERIGFAVLLNEVTTILGFASVGLGTLPVLRAFGIAAGIGMVLRFLVTLIVLPALLGLVARRLATPRTAGASEPGPAGRRVDAFVDHLHARPGWLMTVLALVTLAGLAALAGLPRGNDLIGFLGKGDPIARRVRAVEKEMSGTETLHLVLRGAPGDFEQPATLRRLRDLTADVRDDGGVDSATSFADVVAWAAGALRGDGAPGVLPPTSSGVAQVLFFVDPRATASYVTPDRSAAEVIVRTARHDETGLLRLAGALRTDAAKAGFDPAGILVAGSGLAAAEAAQSITTAQAASLGGMVVTLFVIVAAIFLSVRIALAAVAVNLVAVAAMFILMRLTGIPLNVGTCMIASITLGVVIDDTLHFLVRYSREVRIYKEEHAAIRAAAREEVLAALSTAAALAGGFAILGFSGFVPVRQFGLLSAAVIVIAVAADVFMSPVLFARARVVTLWDVIGLSLRQVLLEECPVFTGLRPWQARRLVLASDLLVLKDGDAIGGPGADPALYVVLDGEVDRRDGGARLGPGAVFGAMEFAAGDAWAPAGHALAPGRDRGVFTSVSPVSAVAAGPARVLALSRRSMESLRRFSPF